MSRTYKDKDFFIRFPQEKYDFGRERSENGFWIWLDVPGIKTKKPRHYKGDWKWYKRTPGWFVREFMTAPKRRDCRDWESKVKYAVDLEEIEDCPDFGKKPHIYYY